MSEITDLHKVNSSQFMNQCTWKNKDYLKNNTLTSLDPMYNEKYLAQCIKETPKMTGIQYNNVGYNTLTNNDILRKHEFNDNILYGVKYQRFTELGHWFFSRENVEFLYILIQRKIKEHKIIKNDNYLLQFMMYAFNNFAPPTPDWKTNLNIINIIVVNAIVPYIISDIKQHDEYLKNINSPFKPIELPINTNVKGRKTNVDYISKITGK
jgi:hypothetical protein